MEFYIAACMIELLVEEVEDEEITKEVYQNLE